MKSDFICMQAHCLHRVHQNVRMTWRKVNIFAEQLMIAFQHLYTRTALIRF